MSATTLKTIAALTICYKNSLILKILKISAITKGASFKSGALYFLAAPLSVGFVQSLKLILKDVRLYDVVLPILAISGCITIYFIFWIVDFSWGLVASKHESNGEADWIKSEKLYSSIGKIGGVLLVDFLALSMVMFLTIIGFIKIGLGILIIGVLLNVLAIFYEIHSIGENIKRKTGEKPPLYTFFDKMTSVIEKALLRKVEKQIDD